MNELKPPPPVQLDNLVKLNGAQIHLSFDYDHELCHKTWKMPDDTWCYSSDNTE